MTSYTGSEVVGFFLSGGASNASPAASLGGIISSQKMLGMYPQIIEPVAGLVVEDATPECGPGEASIVVAGGEVRFSPPAGAAGAAKAVAEGERVFIPGGTATMGVWVYRAAGLAFEGTCTLRLVDQLNGALSMSDIPDADRAAGVVCYRALFLKRLGAAGTVSLWVTTDGQSTYALAEEEPDVDDEIQTIADEETAPSGLSWEAAVNEGSALAVAGLALDEFTGIWIRRTFPAAGSVAANEQVNLHVKMEEGG